MYLAQFYNHLCYWLIDKVIHPFPPNLQDTFTPKWARDLKFGGHISSTGRGEWMGHNFSCKIRLFFPNQEIKCNLVSKTSITEGNPVVEYSALQQRRAEQKPVLIFRDIKRHRHTYSPQRTEKCCRFNDGSTVLINRSLKYQLL